MGGRPGRFFGGGSIWAALVRWEGESEKPSMFTLRFMIGKPEDWEFPLNCFERSDSCSGEMERLLFERFERNDGRALSPFVGLDGVLLCSY